MTDAQLKEAVLGPWPFFGVSSRGEVFARRIGLCTALLAEHHQIRVSHWLALGVEIHHIAVPQQIDAASLRRRPRRGGHCIGGCGRARRRRLRAGDADSKPGAQARGGKSRQQKPVGRGVAHRLVR